MTWIGLIVGLVIIVMAFALIVFVADWIWDNSYSFALQSLANVISFCIIVAITVTIFNGLYGEDSEVVEAYKIKIYALEDGRSLSGTMWYFEEEGKIHYLKEYKGGKKIHTIPSDKAYFVESDIEIPHIKVFRNKIINQSWIAKVLCGDRKFKYGIEEYQVVIPNDSLSYDFNVDLK